MTPTEKTRLSPVYARDVFSFLDYIRLQECRLVSHSVNATIVSHPVSISARRRLRSLTFSVESEEDFYSPPVDGDGYADMPTGHEWDDPLLSWKEVQARLGCCREDLKDLAESLVGERILPFHPAESLVEFTVDCGWRCYPDIDDRGGIFRARNEMTAETAFGVLHLLEHLRCAYASEHYALNASEMALNPSIIQLLTDEGGGAYKLRVELYELGALPDTVQTLAANLAHLKVRELLWDGRMDLELLFEFALRGRPSCNRIRVGIPTNGALDAALQYFRSGVGRIGRAAVSELVLDGWTRGDRINDVDFWPAVLPPKRDMEVLGCHRGSGSDFYRLPGGMANVNSGERFDVVVSCRWIDDKKDGKALSEVLLFFR